MLTKTLSRQTKTPSANDNKSGWYIIDARDRVLGRLAVVAANLLMGKGKTTFTKFLDSGDHVIVINAKHVAVTGRKEAKPYYHHSGFPGGLKETSLAKLRKTYPDRIIKSAIKGMLPKNKLNAIHIKKLHIFEGDTHTYEDKNPMEVKIG